MRELTDAYVEAGRWHDEPPDVEVRCLSEDTEILTRYGWRGIDSMPSTGTVLTMHPLTEELQWQEIEGMVVHDVEPEMVHITGKGMDILVTPDHKMVVRSRTGRRMHEPTGGWYYLTADKVFESRGGHAKNGAGLEIPVSGWSTGVAVNLTDAELWFLGFFMADGSFVRNGQGERYAMRVHQANDHRGEVESRLRLAGIDDFTTTKNASSGDEHFDHRHSRFIYTRQDCSTWYIGKKRSMPLIGHLHEDKTLTDEMMRMTAEQFGHLLAGFKYGDGAKDHTRLFNSNEKMLDQLQILLTLHGYKTNIHYQNYYTTKRGQRKRAGVLNYSPKRSVGIGHKKQGFTISRERYGRRSWCVMVPNRTIVTRRNGCVAIVGNSHRHRNAEVRIQTYKGFATVCTTAAWQLKTPFAYRIAGARQSLPQIGGTLVRAGDEDCYTRHFVKSLSRPQEIVL
jgi:hypothetical protein